jgi:hypothetical protein
VELAAKVSGMFLSGRGNTGNKNLPAVTKLFVRAPFAAAAPGFR